MLSKSDETVISLLGRKERTAQLLNGESPYQYNFNISANKWSEEQALYYLQYTGGEIAIDGKPTTTHLYNLNNEIIKEFGKLNKLHLDIVASIRADKPHRYKSHFAAVGKMLKDMSMLVPVLPTVIIDAEEFLLKEHLEDIDHTLDGYVKSSSYDPFEKNIVEKDEESIDGYVLSKSSGVPENQGTQNLVVEFEDRSISYETTFDGYVISVVKNK